MSRSELQYKDKENSYYEKYISKIHLDKVSINTVIDDKAREIKPTDIN